MKMMSTISFRINKPVLMIVLICLLSLVTPHILYSGIETVACCDSSGYCGYSIGSLWNDTDNGTRYICTCYSGGGSCSPSDSSGGDSSGQSSSYSNSSGLSMKDSMKLQMFQGILDGFMKGFNDGLSNAQREKETQEAQEETQRKAEAEWERKKAEWRAKTIQQIKEMETEYQKMQQKIVDERKTKILSGLKGMDTTDTESQTPGLQQLRCNAYWSMKAAEALLAGDDFAKEYTRFAETPDAASMAECTAALPQLPDPGSPDDFRKDLYESLTEEINIRLPLIVQAQGKQREANDLVANKKRQVEELKVKKEQITTPDAEEKQETDDGLLSAALKELEAANTLKSEADATLGKLKMEVDALNEVGQMATSSPK